MKLIALLSLAWRAAAAATSPEYVKERYIVKLCEASWLDREPAETAAALAESVGARVKHVYKHALSGFSVTDCSAEAAEALKNKPEVCSVLPSRRTSHSMAESGSGQEPIEAINFWGKNRVLDLPLDDRGDQSKGALGGKGVSIVIVDSGLDTQHVEFSNTDERVVANVADCVAGWKYYPAWGWDTLAAANATIEDTLNTDFNAHGTHVSGIAAGKNVGIAPRADLYQIRSLDADNLLSQDDALCAVDTMHEVILEGYLSDRTVFSMSLGGVCDDEDIMSADPEISGGLIVNPQSCRDGAEENFAPLLAKGAVVTIAAGNDADDACFYTPAAATSTTTVGASDRNDHTADFSNFGACVDTVAPGVDIWSALTSHLVVATNTTPAGAEDMYRVMSGTSQATPRVAGTIALFAEALDTNASAADAQNAMLHANERSTVAPNGAQNGSAVPFCPSNAALIQAPRTVEGDFNTSSVDLAAGCQLAEPRLFGFENGSAPADQCDLQPSEPVNTTYKLTLFNGDPRFKLCLAYEYLRGNATVVDFTAVVAGGESIEVSMPTGDFTYQFHGLPNHSNETCAAAGTPLVNWSQNLKLEANKPGPVIGRYPPTNNEQFAGAFLEDPDTQASKFIHAAPGVGNCNLFLRAAGTNAGLTQMVNREVNYAPYGSSFDTHPFGSCLGEPHGISDTVQMVLSCTDGVDSWTVTKNVCPDWFCPGASLVWVASYCPKEYCPETEGLHLTVAQTRLCGKEDSCAAGGHDDNDDNHDHSHSDGAAATGPLALAAAITILVAML